VFTYLSKIIRENILFDIENKILMILQTLNKAYLAIDINVVEKFNSDRV